MSQGIRRPYEAADMEAIQRLYPPPHNPTDVRRDPRYDLLTNANQKEKSERSRGPGHKQKREGDQGGEHLSDIIDA